MKVEMLTVRTADAKPGGMMSFRIRMRLPLGLLAGLAPLGLTGGCVTLKAPEKPIEINLNINIKQEVVYRLDGEAKNLIRQEPGIF